MQHYAAFHLGLHCLQKYSFRGFRNTKGYFTKVNFKSPSIFLQVRLYSVAILDTEITEHIGYVTLSRTVLKSYGHLHFTMEESSGATTLTNAGVLSAATANLSGGRFVTVSFIIPM